MKNFMITTAALLALTAAMPAFAADDATCGDADQSTWMSEADIIAKGVELGYEVANVKVEKGCYELYAKKDGEKFEVLMNPVSGDVVTVKAND